MIWPKRQIDFDPAAVRSQSYVNVNQTNTKCVRLSRSTLASAVCSAATPAGSSTASCVLALSNPSRAILARRRVGPPHLRAHSPPPRTSLRDAPDRPARVHRVGPSRSPSTLPYPSRPSRRDFASPPPSHLAESCLTSRTLAPPPPSTGARHPARRPDALGQDDWRRR